MRTVLALIVVWLSVGALVLLVLDNLIRRAPVWDEDDPVSGPLSEPDEKEVGPGE